MTETVRKCIENNITIIEGDSIWCALQNWDSPEYSIIELTDVLDYASIDFNYNNVPVDDVYKALKHVFEKEVVVLRGDGHKVSVKLLKNQIKIEVSTNLGQMHPSDIQRRTKDAEASVLNIVSNIETVCKSLHLPTHLGEFKVEERWGQRYYRAITCRQAIYIKI